MRKLTWVAFYCVCLGAVFGAESTMPSPGAEPKFAVGWDPANSQLLFDAKLGKSVWGEFALGGQWDTREGAEDDLDILASTSVRMALMQFQALVLNLKLSGIIDDIGREDESDGFDAANAGDVRIRMLAGFQPEWILGRYSLGFSFGTMIAVYPVFRISENGPTSISGLIALRIYF